MKMRKEIVAPHTPPPDSTRGAWLDLASHGSVQITSEEPTHPIEAAFEDRNGDGWKAASPGDQTIWINFDRPQTIREICLRFEVSERRTQEFALSASTDGGGSYGEIVRQQFNFSSAANTEEEHYFVQLDGLTDLKLTIRPDISGGDSRATLRVFKIR